MSKWQRMPVRKPHRVVPSMDPELPRDVASARLVRLLYSPAFFGRAVEFLSGSFEDELRSCAMFEEFWAEELSADEDEEDARTAALRAAVSRVLHAHDYFEVLSLPRDATAADVKRSFMKLSKDVHPDKNPATGAAEAFTRLQEARETLSDASRRDAYAASHPPDAKKAKEWAKAVERQAAATAARGARAWARSQEAKQRRSAAPPTGASTSMELSVELS